MQQKFDSVKFIQTIGNRLVDEISNARKATTPGIVGAAVERPVREQLENILPRGIAVGQGCVIDSYGNVSQQIDIVLYERDICPVFKINNTPEATYYPCEGVIAVGEIKSVLNTNGLNDAFNKIKSVKALARYWHPSDSTENGTEVSYRKYGAQLTIADIVTNNKAKEDELRDIYGFVLAGRSEVSIERLLNDFVVRGVPPENSLCPNSLLVLNEGWLQPAVVEYSETTIKATESRNSFRTGKDVIYCDSELSFNRLVKCLYDVYQLNRTSEVGSFQRYLADNREGKIPVTAKILASDTLANVL